MDPREAYDAILSALGADRRKRVVRSDFDERSFGNFIVGFEEAGKPGSIVNDRGELAVCGDLDGSRDCTTVILSLRDVDAQTVLRALRL